MTATAYIAGPITGVAGYRERFAAAEAELQARGYIVLNPARLPEGMHPEQYMRIYLAMIDSADVVFFLPGWDESGGAAIERAYCKYTNIPYEDIEGLMNGGRA